MKKLVIPVLLVILSTVLYSCGLSESEKANISVLIELHNINARLEYRLDSNEVASDYQFSLIGVIPENEQDQYIQTHMAVFENEWNSPYKIEKDHKLTLESYLSYCETMGYDPKTFIDILNK